MRDFAGMGAWHDEITKMHKASTKAAKATGGDKTKTAAKPATSPQGNKVAKSGNGRRS